MLFPPSCSSCSLIDDPDENIKKSIEERLKSCTSPDEQCEQVREIFRVFLGREAGTQTPYPYLAQMLNTLKDAGPSILSTEHKASAYGVLIQNVKRHIHEVLQDFSIFEKAGWKDDSIATVLGISLPSGYDVNAFLTKKEPENPSPPSTKMDDFYINPNGQKIYIRYVNCK